MYKLINLFLCCIYSFISFGISEKKANDLIEQSCFSGFYIQNKLYGDGGSTDYVEYGPNNVCAFNINSRNFLSWNNDEIYNVGTGIYSRDFNNYQFVNYGEDKYQNLLTENGRDAVRWGPKESYINSTCKIRAYYHDISFNNQKVTLMFDFTGFLVGDSLLMTAAHGLYRDVTVGMFDDGIDNKYFPGKVEIYGAIGMDDTWGSSYEYYSKGLVIFISSNYISYRTFANDWALIRLDRPLGRELSYRKLADPMDFSGNYKIIGYPSMNQYHLKLDVSNANYSIDTTRQIVEYNVSSVDGMSGAPFYLNKESIESDSGGLPYLCYRAAYGMHVCSSRDHTFGYALTFSSDVKDLVDLLNTRFRPSNVSLSTSSINTKNLSSFSVIYGKDYECKIETRGCSKEDNKLTISKNISENFLSFEFPFPVSCFEARSDDKSCNSKITAEILSTNSSDSVIKKLSFSGGVLNYSESTIRKIVIKLDNDFNGSCLTLFYFNFVIDWDNIPSSLSAPRIIKPQNFSTTTGNENCVSYALSGINTFSGGTILPVDSCGNRLNFIKDYFPARIISGLKRAMLSKNIEMKEIGKYDRCEEGSYKIALVCDPYRYYHAIRQNRSAYWSHFLIGNDPTEKDFTDSRIKIPDECRFLNVRNDTGFTETYFDNSSFLGYFSVRAINNEQN